MAYCSLYLCDGSSFLELAEGGGPDDHLLLNDNTCSNTFGNEHHAVGGAGARQTRLALEAYFTRMAKEDRNRRVLQLMELDEAEQLLILRRLKAALTGDET